MLRSAIAALSFSVIALLGVSTAQADFDRDRVERTAGPAVPILPFELTQEITQVSSLSELDLAAPLSREELARIEASVLQAFGNRAEIHAFLPLLFSQLRARARSASNVMIYLGADLGAGLGFSANLVLVIAHGPEAGQLALYPAFMTRIQAFDSGANVHLGLGTLEGKLERPRATVGVLMGGSYVVGGSFGWSTQATTWVELHYGASLQAGPYLEFLF